MKKLGQLLLYTGKSNPQSLDAVLLSQDADLEGHIIALAGTAPVLLGTPRGSQAVLIKSKCWTMFHHVEDQGSLQCEHKGHERQLG